MILGNFISALHLVLFVSQLRHVCSSVQHVGGYDNNDYESVQKNKYSASAISQKQMAGNDGSLENTRSSSGDYNNDANDKTDPRMKPDEKMFSNEVFPNTKTLSSDKLIYPSDVLSDQADGPASRIGPSKKETTSERSKRAAISTRAPENHLPRSRNRNKDCKCRKVRVAEVREMVTEAIVSTVSAALRQELQPLQTALRIVRLDTFTEGIVRQLSTLEHIQSKMLTEYGEMRETVGQASRTVQDLAQQVASLDTNVNSLSREVQTSSNGGASFDGNSGGHIRTEDIKSMMLQASAAFSASLRATERRLKEDLGNVENRMTDAIQRSQTAFDTRLTSITSDTNRILNQSCINNEQVASTHSFTNNKLFSLNDANIQLPKYPFAARTPGTFSSINRRHLHNGNLFLNTHTTEETNIVLSDNIGQTDTGSVDEGVSRREDIPSDSFPSLGRSEIHDLASVTKLATEIATQIAKDTRRSPRDCSDVAASGETINGIYTIYPSPCSTRVALNVWCDLTTDGGSWTLVQRRGSRDSGRDDFFRDWSEYKWGFGDLENDHWIGNEYISQLTSSGDYELRIDVTDWSDERRWAMYSHFSLADENGNYSLTIGEYRGTAGNSLKYHLGAPFSTKDRDNDNNPMSHCARTFHGAWWFTACHESHLNGRYHRSPHRTYGDGINWMTFRGLNYSHKSSRMMIRAARSAPSAPSRAGPAEGPSN